MQTVLVFNEIPGSLDDSFLARLSLVSWQLATAAHQPIGHARSDIEEGEHVHAHNVASLFTDWLSSQTGQADRS